MSRRARFALVTVLVVGAGVWAWRASVAHRGKAEPKWETTALERRDVVATISATGTLSARDTVEIGSQVSGILSEVLVDFNDQVRKGQLLARLDTELLDAGVRDAEAGLARSRAELARSSADLDRNRKLFEQGIVSEQSFQLLESSVEVARAAAIQAATALERARTNRAHAEIRSPIDGIVIERTVDAGQTVAASLQSPRLFLVARDLSQMEILLAVDESDVGALEVAQPASFSVAAHGERRFDGTVRQIRLQPTVVQDVVTYTVVVEAPNPDGTLLPGMTATVDVVVARAEDALVAPVAALRLVPNDAMRLALPGPPSADGGGAGGRRQGVGTRPAASDRRGDAAGAERRAAGGFSGGDRTSGPGREGFARLFIDDGAGHLSAVPVKLGVSDGLVTAVLPLRDQLAEGTLVVSKALGASQTPAGRSTANPLGGSGPPQGGGLRRMGL